MDAKATVGPMPVVVIVGEFVSDVGFVTTTGAPSIVLVLDEATMSPISRSKLSSSINF